MLIGYARTSTIKQEAGHEAQSRDLKAAGCEKIFAEQLSSVEARRPQLEAAIDFAREGDTLIVTKLDRFVRSVADLIRIDERLKSKKIALRILNLSIDTGTPTGRLQLNVMASVAQFEREMMLERQIEGIAKAKADGKYAKVGRKNKTAAKSEEAKRLRAEGMGMAMIARTLGLSLSSAKRATGQVKWAPTKHKKSEAA